MIALAIVTCWFSLGALALWLRIVVDGPIEEWGDLFEGVFLFVFGPIGLIGIVGHIADHKSTETLPWVKKK